MKGWLFFVLTFLIACSGAEKGSVSLKGSVLLKGSAGKQCDAVGLTESYLVLLDRASDTTIQVFKKEDLSRLHAFALKGYGFTYFSNPEFMKSNTKEPAGKDEFWIVDNQLTFNRVRVTTDSLQVDRKYISIADLIPATHYSVTTKEVYAVPIVEKDVYGSFCYANDEEGTYWVDPPKVEKAYRSCKHIAYLPNLCVNEPRNSVVAALRFWNRIDFYDLKGTFQKSFIPTQEPIVPLLKEKDAQVDIEGTNKCFIDIFGTDRYVYCLYDGSVDFSNRSTLLVLTWDGELKKCLHLDRPVKKIAVDPSDRFIVTLAAGENETWDVVRYEGISPDDGSY